MSPRPLVSVIMPTHNRAGLIGQSLRSVLDQTCQDFEILVADDASTDDTEAVTAALGDPRIRYERLPRAGRPAVPRNAALRRARGRYIAFLDSDDLWLPAKLERQLDLLARRPELLGCATNIRILPEGRDNAHRLERDLTATFADTVRFSVPLTNSSMLLDAAVLDAVGLLDEDPALRGTEDHDYWLRILRHRDRSLVVLAETLTAYRLHGGNLLGVDDASRELAMLKIIYAKHLDFLPGVVGPRLAEVERRLAEVPA